MTPSATPIRLPVLALLVVSAGCAGTLLDPASFEAATDTSDAGTIEAGTGDAGSSCPDIPTTLLGSCGQAGCHDPTTHAEQLDLASPNVASRLVGVAAIEGPGYLIDPNIPTASVVYTKLLATPPFGARMPSAAGLDDATTQCVLAWVTTEASTTPVDADGGASPTDDGGFATQDASTDAGSAFSPLRVAAGQTSPVTDAVGNTWSADTDFTGGTAAVTSPAAAITGTDTPALYNGQRYGDPSFTYQFTVPNGEYTVTLQVAEQDVTAAGQREFDIAINGASVETNFDIYATAGGMNIALDESFPVTVSGGSIQVAFTPGAIQSPKVDAIQITQGESVTDGGTD